MEFIEPLKTEKKLKDYLDTGNYKKVGIFFWHGLGDCVQFQVVLHTLKQMYPFIKFNMIIPKGLDEEVIFPEADLITCREDIDKLDYDLVSQVNMPVETDPNLTKSELCCREELGIPPVWGHCPLPKYPNRLVGVHFNITCLPGLANPSEEVAKDIWDEIKEAGWLPLETHFEHVFHNPVNKKFDFVNSTVRGCTPKVSTLIGLIQNCGAFIGVVSGNFHVAMSCLPIERIAFLQKEIPVDRFTRHKVKVIDVKNYEKGIVKEWLSAF
jgi:hypothetical protein